MSAINEHPPFSMTQRAALYRLLAQLFLYEADERLKQAIGALNLAPLLDALAPGSQDWVQKPLDEPERERLACLYAELFLLGRGSLSLQASAWLNEEPERLAGLEKMIRAAEPEGVTALGNLPPDHLGVVLCYLACAYASEAAPTRALAAELDQELLGPWAGRFAAALSARTDEPLYRAAAALLLAMVAHDEERAA